MPNLFVLDVHTEPEEHRATLRLQDGAGVHLEAQEVRLADHKPSLWEGVFDTREHVERYAGVLRPTGHTEPLTAEELLAQIGVFLGRHVLGKEILDHLYDGIHQRTLIVRLPVTEKDPLAAAFARVPWEIARPALGKESLFTRNLAVRAITGAEIPEDQKVTLPLASGETLRVLLVFAQAPGSHPLAMRLERERLLELFYEAILPAYKVQIDVLCHGVTDRNIEEQVRKARGYHILHWSGHGHHNLLELIREAEWNKPEKEQQHVISSKDLIDLFRKAGGFIPSLVFLSACHSGSFISAKDFAAWSEAVLKSPSPNPSRQGRGIGLPTPDPSACALHADRSQEGNSQEVTIGEVSPPLVGGAGGGGTTSPSNLETLLQKRQGYTGTALELLRSGVQQVVAMRYAVSDTYARQLACWFYQHLLAEGHAADTALTLARNELQNDPRQAAQYSATDHAMPLLFGRNRLVMTKSEGRSEQLDTRYPQPTLQRELYPVPHFVGRGKELTRLMREWLLRAPQTASFAPVALIQGLAGLGKTALAAEAIHLWHRRFNWVLAVQAKGYPLPAEAFYQDLDKRLTLASNVYRKKCREDEYRKIWLSKGEYTGENRYQIMRDNLIRALHDEHILLVIDNFETNLLTDNTCQDPEWTNLLADFCSRLQDSGSRMLITSRHRPAVFPLLGGSVLSLSKATDSPPGRGKGWVSESEALPNRVTHPQPLPGGEFTASPCENPYLSAGRGGGGSPGNAGILPAYSPPGRGGGGFQGCVWLPLGPLPFEEAVLLLQSHPGLRELWHKVETRWLALGVLEISRGHPLILQRLGDLAGDVDALKAALEKLKQEGYKRLPDLVSGAQNDEERDEERRYLEDVAIGAVDLLLGRISPDARQLLWVTTLAFEPAPAQLLAGVWEGKSVEQEQLEKLRELLVLIEKLLPELQAKFQAEMGEIPEEIRALLEPTPGPLRQAQDRLSQEGKSRQDACAPRKPAPGPLLNELTEAGLLQKEGEEAEAIYSFHELVRERCGVWMEAHPQEKGGREEKQIWRAYGERYADIFDDLLKSGKPGSRETATEMGRRALMYFVRAGDFDALGNFASDLIISTRNPQQLQAVIAELQTIVEQAPEGKGRWRMLGTLAAALARSGQPEQSLPFYAQAAAEAEAAQDWADVGAICQNWAGALQMVGQLAQAAATYQRATQTKRKAGSSEVDIMGSELEALRIGVMQGEAAEVLPEIEARLTKVRDWQRRMQQGETVAEASNAELLGRSLISALDIGQEAHLALEHWQACLDLLRETEEIERVRGESEHERARTRFNQYPALIELGRLAEAQQVLEGCLQVFREGGGLTSAGFDAFRSRGCVGRTRRPGAGHRARTAGPGGPRPPRQSRRPGDFAYQSVELLAQKRAN
jgi:hypothetical protein